MNDLLDQGLPSSIDAEKAILGAILLEDQPNCVLQASESLRRDDFFLDSHRRIFDKMVSLNTHSMPINLITLAEELRREGEFERVGGATYISSLIDAVPSSDNIEPYMGMLKTKNQARRLIAASQQILELALNDPDDENLVARCQQVIYDACERFQQSPFMHIADAAQEWLEEVEQVQDGPGGGGLLTGLQAIDIPLSGLQRGELLIIAGRPSNGKTTLALDLARRLGTNKQHVAFFSLEMGRRRIGERTLAAEGRLDTFQFRTAGRNRSHQWVKDKWAEAQVAMQSLRQCGVWVVDDAQLSATTIRAKAQRFRREYGALDVLMVDYLGLMEFPNVGREKYYQVVGEAARKMKQLARELDCAVVLVHQLNRAAETEQEPQLYHLADSGDIEKHADSVVFVYKVPDKDYDKTFVKVAKNRNGPLGLNEVSYIRSEHRFENLARY